MTILRAPVVKDSHILAVTYFIFLRKNPRPKLKNFQHQIQTTVNRSKK